MGNTNLLAVSIHLHWTHQLCFEMQWLILLEFISWSGKDSVSDVASTFACLDLFSYIRYFNCVYFNFNTRFQYGAL